MRLAALPLRLLARLLVSLLVGLLVDLLVKGDRRQVAVLVQVELAVPDAEHERVPLGLGEVKLPRLGLGRVVHHPELGLASLVRRFRSVRGHVYLDPALALLHEPKVTAAVTSRAQITPRSPGKARRTGRSGRRGAPARSGSA